MPIPAKPGIWHQHRLTPFRSGSGKLLLIFLYHPGAKNLNDRDGMQNNNCCIKPSSINDFTQYIIILLLCQLSRLHSQWTDRRTLTYTIWNKLTLVNQLTFATSSTTVVRMLCWLCAADTQCAMSDSSTNPNAAKACARRSWAWIIERIMHFVNV